MISAGDFVRTFNGVYGVVQEINESEQHFVLDAITNEIKPYYFNQVEPVPVIKWKRVVEDVNAPRYVKPGDAGFDIHSAEEKSLPARSKTIVRAGIALNIPRGYYVRLSSRSGLSAKNNIEVGAGTIDETFTGEIQVILYNHGDIPYFVAKNERICQGVLLRYENALLAEVDDLSSNNIRGASGFGDSGRF